jgi:SAM-dependent MidA family methyltransferase
MNEWLYAQDGYYATHKTIGKDGDFYTAVSSSQFFGGSIANRLLKTINEGFLSKNSYVVEIGAHKGYLLADMVQFIYTLEPKLLETLTFVIVEPFVSNQKEQLKYFEDSFGDAINLLHVKSLKELTCKEAFFVANEIFDAFSCELIKDNKMVYMKEHTPYFEKIPLHVEKVLNKYNITKGEVALGYEEFAKDMAKSSQKFEFVTFDYGERSARNDFSIRIYHKHKVYPFFALTDFVKDEELKEDVKLEELYKKSDITYDVNFEHLIGAYSEAGVTCKEYSSQMKALVEFGLIELLDILKNNADQKTYKAELNRVKTLIDPAFMGERFKMARFRN